ncbi:MAG TPA: hypothetical protein VGE12_11315 [Noviherbaspirillum sp.]
MSRITLSIEEMNTMIRAEMRKHEECGRVSLRSVYWHEPDVTGCNWDVDMGEAADMAEVNACRERIIDAVRDFRAHYNIVRPD